MKNKNIFRTIYIFVAIIIFIGSFIIIKNYDNSISKIIKKEAIVIDPTKYDSKNDGKLVIATGKLTTVDKIVDPDFLVEIRNATKLERVVQVFRYYGDEKLKTVGTRWENITESHESEVIDKNGKTYINVDPAIDITDSTFLIDAQMNGIEILAENFENFKINSTIRNLLFDKLEVVSSLNENIKFYIQENYITTYETTPSVGDIRITYNYYDLLKTKEFTVIGKQEANQIVPYEIKKDKSISGVYEGKLSAKDIAQKFNPKGGLIKTIVIIIDVITALIGLIIISKKENIKTNY